MKFLLIAYKYLVILADASLPNASTLDIVSSLIYQPDNVLVMRLANEQIDSSIPVTAFRDIESWILQIGISMRSSFLSFNVHKTKLFK